MTHHDAMRLVHELHTIHTDIKVLLFLTTFAVVWLVFDGRK